MWKKLMQSEVGWTGRNEGEAGALCSLCPTPAYMCVGFVHDAFGENVGGY
jgi:hypothetical protein